MADFAHKWTDDQIERLEALLQRLYGKTAAEMGRTLDDLMQEHMAKYGEDLEARLDVDGTPEGNRARDSWLTGQAAAFATVAGAVVAPLVAIGLEAERKREELINAALPEVYAQNHNFTCYVVDRKLKSRRGRKSNVKVQIDFNLMDKDTARLLLNPTFKVVPGSRATSLHEAWYRTKLRACITRGILRGDSIPRMAKDIRTVTDMSRNAAVRAARTACTHAENAGRIRGMERAIAMGIPVKKVWEATLDNRTRDSHRDLDGEVREVHERFSNGLMEPGDYSGDPAEYYNCRCTLNNVIEGIDSGKGERWNRFDDGEDYESWKAGWK